MSKAKRDSAPPPPSAKGKFDAKAYTKAGIT